MESARPKAGNLYQACSFKRARVSPWASVLGNVSLGKDVSVLAFASIRGDLAPIVIEDESNVQEGVVIHVSAGHPTTIHRHATIGHGAIIHGCEIGENSVVGMGAAIMDGAVIGAESVVGAHALVTGGKAFPPRSLLVGSPARVKRQLTEEEIGRMCTAAGDRYLAITERMLQEGALELREEDWTGKEEGEQASSACATGASEA